MSEEKSELMKNHNPKMLINKEHNTNIRIYIYI